MTRKKTTPAERVAYLKEKLAKSQARLRMSNRKADNGEKMICGIFFRQLYKVTSLDERAHFKAQAPMLLVGRDLERFTAALAHLDERLKAEEGPEG